MDTHPSPKFIQLLKKGGVIVEYQSENSGDSAELAKFVMNKPLFRTHQYHHIDKAIHICLTVQKNSDSSKLAEATSLIQLQLAQTRKSPRTAVMFTLVAMHQLFDLFNAHMLVNYGKLFSKISTYAQFTPTRVSLFNYTGYENVYCESLSETEFTIRRAMNLIAPGSSFISNGSFQAVALNKPDSVATFLDQPYAVQYFHNTLKHSNQHTKKMALEILVNSVTKR